MMQPTVYSQLAGDSGVYQTVYMMKSLVNKSFLHPWIRERAARIIANCNRNRECEHFALLGYVNQKMQYVRDPAEVEALQDPVTVIENSIRHGKRPFGDCDDMSMYFAALLKAVGHVPSFRILSRIGNNFHHVHVICHGTLLDPTLEMGRFPTQASRAVQIKI